MGRKINVNNRIGSSSFNNHGSEMIVEEYNSFYDVYVRFVQTGNIVKTRWDHFCSGSIRNPLDKTVCGIGYIGEGLYKTHENGSHSKKYTTWSGMLQRCYGKTKKVNNPSYLDCSVVEEWHNFQNFAKWYDENYYEVDGQRIDLDKDILKKGNKIYSPETCIFAPKIINSLFVKNDSVRGINPIGVRLRKFGKYQAACNDINGKMTSIGHYLTAEEAFMAYKHFKENVIVRVAEKYKENIPDELYNALITYEIEIND